MRFVLALTGCCFVYSIAVILSDSSRCALLRVFGTHSLQFYILSVYIQDLLRVAFKIVINKDVLTDFNVQFSVGVIFFIVLLVASEIARRLICRMPVLGRLLLGE